MIAKQSVYLDETRKKALPEGDPKARFLLVFKGQEIADKRVAEIEGADVLINADATKAAPKKDSAKELETRDDRKGKKH